MSAPFLPMTTPGRAEWIVDAALLVRPLDDDLRDRGLLQALHQNLADLHVLVQELAVFVLAGEPARIPGPVDAETQADRIDFLTHRSLLRPASAACRDFAHDDRQIARTASRSGPARPRARGLNRFITIALPTYASATTRSSTSRLVVVLGVGDRALQRLAARRRRCACARIRDRRAPSSTFLPRMSCARRLSFCGLTRSMRATALASFSPSARGLACLGHDGQPLFAFLSAAWPWKVRVGENSPNLWPIISSVTDDRHMLVAVIDAEGQADELRQDRRAAAPDLDDVGAARAARDDPPSSADSRRRTGPSRSNAPWLSPSSCGRDARRR